MGDVGAGDVGTGVGGASKSRGVGLGSRDVGAGDDSAGIVGASSSETSLSTSNGSGVSRTCIAKAPRDAAVGGNSTGVFVGRSPTTLSGSGGNAVKAPVRVVRRPFDVGAYLACAYAPDGVPELGEAVNEVSHSSITAAWLCPVTFVLLQHLAVQPAIAIQEL